MRIIDFHAHAFPDALAARAMPALEEEGNVKAALDGTIASLLRSMDEAGIEISVVQSIATKPKQFDPILAWSRSIASDRLIPFPSIHPDDPDAPERLRQVQEAGFKGIKLHPYYQEFRVDEERLWPVYDRAQELGIVLFVHTGFDLAYPRYRLGDPARTAKVIQAFPDLKFVTTHFGAWEDWDEVRRLILGRPIFMELSYSVHIMGTGPAKDLAESHPAEYLIFGSDSPWRGQKESIEDIRSLELAPETERRLFYENAARLLGIG